MTLSSSVGSFVFFFLLVCFCCRDFLFFWNVYWVFGVRCIIIMIIMLIMIIMIIMIII